MVRALSPPLPFAAFALLFASAATAQVPQGDDLQVNDYTTSLQKTPAITVHPDGAFVVVWQSYGSGGLDTSSYSIQARRFAENGDPIGNDIEINSYTTGGQATPTVAGAPDGGFVIAWDSSGSAGSDPASSIQARRFATDGQPVGDDFQVNSYTDNLQSSPAIAVHTDGDFVVVWQSNSSGGSDASGFSIQARRFAENGDPVGDDFQVNSYTNDNQRSPAIATTPEGGFVVTWESNGSAGSDTSFSSIQARRFAASGAPIGDDFQVNSYTDSLQAQPAIAVHTDGHFVVVWQSVDSGGSDTSSLSVQARRFTANGDPVGDDFQVNSYTTSTQLAPIITIDKWGDFVVTWRSTGSGGSDSSSYSIQARRFAANGDSIGDDFQVNTYTNSYQTAPALAMDPDGDFVVAWESNGSSGSDSSSNSIQARRFRVTADLGDTVWDDLDFDGRQTPGEPGIEGVEVNLYTSDSTLVDSTTTDPSGNFLFRPKAGEYFLEFELPLTYSFTGQDFGGDDTIDSDADTSFGQTIDIIIEESVDQDQWDAGMANGVGDRVWQDLDGNGIQDGGEEGLEGVFVALVDAKTGMGTGAFTLTDANGRYHLNNLPPGGPYFLNFLPPAGYSASPADQGSDDELDSDINPLYLNSPIFWFENGDLDRSIDAGFVPDATPTGVEIGDRVWLDDGDGIYQGGEPGVAGVTVNLYDASDALIANSVTDSNGIYALGLEAGTYYLEVELPSDMAFGLADEGGDDAFDSDFSQSTGTTSPFTLADGQTDLSRDAALEPAALGNRAWEDLNRDGRQQPGEPGVPGVTVRLLDAADQEIATAVTDANGIYRFFGLASSDYRLEFLPPVPGTFSSQHVGGNDLIDSDVDPVTGRTALISYEAGTARRHFDAGLDFSIFRDGFESGDATFWSSQTP